MNTVRSLDYAEQWLRDGLDVCRPAAYYQVLDVDMTVQKSLVQQARLQGKKITYTHLLVRATALALAANPDLHVLVCGKRVHQLSSIDIGLSVAGETFVAPVVVLEGANNKDVGTLADEIRNTAPKVRDADKKTLSLLRRWGWMVPFACVRKRILKTLFRSLAFRKRGSGTFQVSVMANLDQAIAPMFSTTGILVAGRVQDRVVAVNGAPAVRPMIRLTLSADHRVWDGRAGERLLLTLQGILESDRLAAEVLGPQHQSPQHQTPQQQAPQLQIVTTAVA